MTRLVEHLEQAWRDLSDIARRRYVLSAFQEELDRVSRGKQFCLWNDVAWMMALDSRDMLVIHLDSWSKSLLQKGGLFRWMVSSASPKELTEQLALTHEDRMDPGLARARKKARGRVYRRLFPGATGAEPSKADLKALADEFNNLFEPLADDRNENRAHSYERSSGTATMLDPGAMGAIIDHAARVICDLRLLSEDVTMSIDDANCVHSESAAEDLVDAILIGTSHRHAVVMKGRTRDDYYDQLHAEHDALGADTKKLFNENLQ